jgi:hypothetical protein
MPLLYQHNVDAFIPMCLRAGSRKQEGLTNIPIIGCADAGKPILGEENLEGYLEIDRLVRDRSNLFVLRVKGDLGSNLRGGSCGARRHGPPEGSDHGRHAYEPWNSYWRP